MTVVSANAARPIGADSFADITDDPPTVAVSAGKVVVTFDAELTAEQTTAVRDRMTSRDDADQADRALLRAGLDGGATNLAEMLARAYLGDPMPEPQYPPAT